MFLDDDAVFFFPLVVFMWKVLSWDDDPVFRSSCLHVEGVLSFFSGRRLTKMVEHQLGELQRRFETLTQAPALVGSAGGEVSAGDSFGSGSLELGNPHLVVKPVFFLGGLPKRTTLKRCSGLVVWGKGTPAFETNWGRYPLRCQFWDKRFKIKCQTRCHCSPCSVAFGPTLSWPWGNCLPASPTCR